MTEKELMRTFRFFNFTSVLVLIIPLPFIDSTGRARLVRVARGPRFDASIARVDAGTRARGTRANTRVWGSANIYIMIFSIFIW